MPKFSARSFTKLSTCHIDLQVLFYEVVKTFDCTILQGYRNEADQNAALAAGKSKLAYPKSKHNFKPSLAVDVVPYPLPDWSKVVDFVYFGGYVMGIAQMLFDSGKMTHRIRFGGDFNRNQRISDSSFYDCVHFEIIE